MSPFARSINRRNFLVRTCAAINALALPSLTVGQSGNSRFNRSIVLDSARMLAAMPYAPPQPVPQPLLDLDYDQYRSIRYRKQAAVWGGTPTQFTIEFFAPGNLYNSGVDISVVENGEIFPIDVGVDTFETPTPEIAELLASIGQVAGFRLHYPLNRPDIQDEFVVFQGASYFRTVSKGQNYGLSARGLAIDVAEPTGEEFPVFRKFWIERPSSRADSIVVHAMLDSPSVTGAYRFGIYPDDPTRMDIEATLFARKQLNHVGLGSLTSMYYFGSVDQPDRPDYRSAVHDSEGLAILTGDGEYLWRPLSNPLGLQISAFSDVNPRGFGLAQRSRTVDQYQDLEAEYHRRPSAWVEPIGDWGDGYVALIEIPSASEANDNIVAYWRPRQPIMPDTPFEFAYRMTWPDDSPLPENMGRVVRSAYGVKLGTQFPQMVVDYAGLPPDVVAEDIFFAISFSNGVLAETITQSRGPSEARVFLSFDPEGADLSEIRIQPTYNGAVIGETWLFRWIRT